MGSGIETCISALVIDHVTQTKLVVSGIEMLADITVVYPVLNMTVLLSVTAIDVVVYCVETYFNKKARSKINLYELEGVKL